MAKFSVCRIYKVTLLLNFSYNCSVNYCKFWIYIYTYRAAQVSPKFLLRSDLCFDALFAYLTVRASKFIQFQERLYSLPLPRIPGSLLCPVAALVNHLRINQVPQEMLLFSVRSDSLLSHITYTHFSSFLTRVIKAVGLDSTSYSPHSFRRGGATFAFAFAFA